jgi:TetR/AcrR family transcriptional regulator, ethionamide resistance regulator
MSQYAQMTMVTDSDVEFSFMRALLAAAEKPGIRKIQRTRLRLLAGLAKQLSDGAEQADLRVSDVVAAAGLAHGTFYRYFPDLRSAIEVLIGDFALFLYQQLADSRAGANGSRDRVRGATLTYVRVFKTNAGLMRCLNSLRRDDTAFRKAFLELSQGWNKRVAAAIARRRGVNSAEDLLPTSYALGGMVDQFLTQLYLRQDPALSYLANDQMAVADLLTELWCLGAYGRLPPNHK